MGSLLKDLRLGARALMRSPLTSLVATATLALVVGSNVAVFTLVNGVLLRRLPFEEPERLVLVWNANLSRSETFTEVSYPELLDWRREATSFSGVAAMQSTTSGFTIISGSEPLHIQGQPISVGFLDVIGAQAAVGRTFRAADHEAGAERVVVLSHGLWQRLYGGGVSAVGRSIVLNRSAFTIVGVMPAGFQYPTGAELWTPLERQAPNLVDERGVGWLIGIARLAPHATLAEAQAEMNTLTDRLAREYAPAGVPSSRMAATLMPFEEAYFGRTRFALLTLFGAVALVLVIGVVNVASLLLVRGFGRQRELAVRLALGAGRMRASRQLLLESGLLSLLGGLLGVFLARAFVAAALALSPTDVPGLDSVTIDVTAVGFTLGIVVLTGFICGTVPAVVLTRSVGDHAMLGGAQVSGTPGHRLNRGLVVVEVALALLLLVGAGVMLRSFDNLSSVDLGFDPENLLTMEVPLSDVRYPAVEQRRAFFSELVPRVAALPGVESAGVVLLRPLWSTVGFDWPLTVEGQTVQEATENPSVNLQAVSADYFRTMRIGVIDGRVFTPADRSGAPGVVVVSQSLANRIWPGENPLGRRIKIPLPDTEYRNEWLTVVGMVEPARYRELEGTRLDLYMSTLQNPYTPNHLVVRTSGEPLALVEPIRAVVRSMDADQPVDDVATMAQIVSMSLGDARFRTQLLGAFALVALILAALGLYAVMSYLVTLRTQEIGIRMALGASRRAILALVVSQGLALVVAGTLLGLVGAVGVTRILESLLYGVTPTDPATMIGATTILVVTGVGASLFPAVRATGIDPTMALRSE